MPEANPRESAQGAIKRASLAARKGDLAAAERWSKTAERMAAAAEKLTSLPSAGVSYEEEERVRTELWQRIDRILRTQEKYAQWQASYDEWQTVAKQARLEGREPPPEPQDAYMLRQMGEWREAIERGED